MLRHKYLHSKWSNYRAIVSLFDNIVMINSISSFRVVGTKKIISAVKECEIFVYPSPLRVFEGRKQFHSFCSCFVCKVWKERAKYLYLEVVDFCCCRGYTGRCCHMAFGRLSHV